MMRKIALILLFLCPWQHFATDYVGNVDKPFSISFQGFDKNLEYLKKRSELQMARNTDFCRGALMPAPIGKWSCLKKGPGVSECELQYRCRNVSRTFNRKTEGPRIRKELNGLVKPSGKLKIWISRKPVRNLGRYRVLKASSVPVVSQKVEKPAPKKIVAKKQPVQEDFDEIEDELALLEEESQEKVKEIEEEFVSTDQDEESIDEEELAEVLKDEDESEEDQPAEKAKEEEIDESSYHLARFEGSFLRISDDNGNSSFGFEGGWTPYYYFTKSWGAKGYISVHTNTIASVDPSLEDETFFVFDYGANLIYQGARYYGEAGLGFQKWNNTLSDSLNVFSFGAGYIFETKKLGYLDRIFLRYSSASNEANEVTEIRFGTGISF